MLLQICRKLPHSYEKSAPNLCDVPAAQIAVGRCYDAKWQSLGALLRAGTFADGSRG